MSSINFLKLARSIMKRMPAKMAWLIDTHCHIDLIEAAEGADPDVVAAMLERALAHGVRAFLNPGVSLHAIDNILKLTELYPSIKAAVAIHPSEVAESQEQTEWLQRIEEVLQHPNVLAVGETGLDYYWQAEDKAFQALQRSCFLQSLQLAKRYNKPVIVHDREAHGDTAALVSQVPGVTGVMHCFSGDADFALRMIDLGFYISFAGNVTFKKADMLRQAAKVIPAERLLLETDSPYMSPVPERGRPNEPYRTRFVAECLAEVRGVSFEELAIQTSENACRLFQIEPEAWAGLPLHVTACSSMN
jgi:TatD DNase family protein